ncbi:MAG TPA: hypothetical protein VEH84_18280 [Alphaproteobacteria bacterium]|nr:hypothetical protein [Alphaproteobacteria bacterium]
MSLRHTSHSAHRLESGFYCHAVLVPPPRRAERQALLALGRPGGALGLVLAVTGDMLELAIDDRRGRRLALSAPLGEAPADRQRIVAVNAADDGDARRATLLLDGEAVAEGAAPGRFPNAFDGCLRLGRDAAGWDPAGPWRLALFEFWPAPCGAADLAAHRQALTHRFAATLAFV